MELLKKVEEYIAKNEKRTVKDYLQCTLTEAQLIKVSLEKQMLIKPYSYSDGDASGYPVWEYCCPVCFADLDEYQPKFCPQCGQALDWNEVEE